jgi:hypothetical protein
MDIVELQKAIADSFAQEKVIMQKMEKVQLKFDKEKDKLWPNRYKAKRL